MYAKRGIDQPDPLGAFRPILLPSSPVRGVTVLQIAHPDFQFLGNDGTLIEMQSIHLLDGIVYPGDEGGVGYRILGRVAIIADEEILLGLFLAVLASYAHLAECNWLVASVYGEDKVRL